MIKLPHLKFQKKWLGLSLLFFVFSVGLWHINKPLPSGISIVSEDILIDSSEIDFLSDLTYLDSFGERVYEQEIFDEILKSIEEAEEYILIDMFLFNSWLGNTNEFYRPLAAQMTDALLAARKNNPNIKIDLISDPINIVYGGDNSVEFDKLNAEGVNIILTDLKPLRDSNPAYSSFWRVFLQWLGNDTWPAWVKHPFSEKNEKVSLRSYLSLLNFKANHRKTFLADSGDSYVSIISSANPHTSSSAHSNVAVKIKSTNFASVLFGSELAVAKMSGESLQLDALDSNKVKNTGDSSIRLITEGKIEETLLSLFDEAIKGDSIRIAMFYLSNRSIIKTLKNASDRGVSVQLILDSNKDAFGYEKGGIPNRQVASELVGDSGGKIKIRWYDTNGEQFHSKIVHLEKESGERITVLGSANLTRRNIGDYNLETNVLVSSESSTDFTKDIDKYFQNIWGNPKNTETNKYSIDYSVYEDNSFLKKFIYRFQEFSGLSSF